MYILFTEVFTSHSKEELRAVFKRGLALRKPGTQGEHSEEDEDGAPEEDKLGDFRRGLSEYLLTKFYLKKKQEGLEADLKEKFKVVFELINKQNEGEFIAREVR